MMTKECKIVIDDENHGGIDKPKPSKKKRTRAMHVIKVAMHMLRSNKSKKKAAKKPSPLPLPLPTIPTTTNNALTRLVGSVRPVHLHGNVGGSIESPPPQPPLLLPSPGRGWTEGMAIGTTLLSPGSRSEASFLSASIPSPSPSSSSVSTMSGYASAQNLCALGTMDEEDINVNNDNNNDEVDKYYDGLEGDEFIDAKAEMFIAQFYKQVSLNSNLGD